MGGGFVADHNLPFAVAAFPVAEGPLQQLVQMVGLQRLKPKQARTAHQRLVDLKKWVFGGGTDQGHGAVFNPGQQCVLLGAVEPVHLVDE